MAESERVLIVGADRDGTLQRQLREVNLLPVAAEDFRAAGRALRAHEGSIGAAMLPTQLAVRGLKPELKALRRSVRCHPPAFIAFGEPPDKAARRRLRSAGVELGLWQPIDPASLRFQINRALGDCKPVVRRRVPRAPAMLSARVRVGDRCRDARTYSLAAGGAFLETARASMDDARLDIELGLPGEPLHVHARVMFSNVPGNLHEPRLPFGMGVRFEDLTPEGEQRLSDFVDQRLSQLSV